MVFGVFPKDFNEIELRAVGWQVAEEGIKFLPPTQGEAVVQSMMNSGIVENDEGWNRFSDLRNQIRHESDMLVMGGGDRMCFPNRRPSTLYGRRGRETRFVVVTEVTQILCNSATLTR